MPHAYRGNDDNALALVISDRAISYTMLPRNTRKNIDAAAAAASVTLTSVGNDRVAIDELYDALAVAPLAYTWNATAPEVEAVFNGRATMSNGNMTATRTLVGGLATLFQAGAMPAGLMDGSGTRLDASASGTVTVTLTMPAAGAGPGTDPYATFLYVTDAAMSEIGAAIVNHEADGTYSGTVTTPALGEVFALAATPPANAVFTFDAIGGTYDLSIGGVEYVTNEVYTPGPVYVFAVIAERPGVDTGIGENVVVTLSTTLDPVAAP